RKDYSRTLLVDAEDSARTVKDAVAELHTMGLQELHAEGFKKRDVQSIDFVDMRYRGQSYELTVKLSSDFIEAFHHAHDRRYGYANRGRHVEVVGVRSAFFGRTDKPQLKKTSRQRGRPVPVDTQPVWIDRKRVKTAIYDRATLRHGHAIDG